MSRIAVRAEQEFDYEGWGRGLGRSNGGRRRRAGERADRRRHQWRRLEGGQRRRGGRIICCTNTGATARAISRFRPTAPLLAVTPSIRTARQLTMAWGVQSTVTDEHASTDDIVWFGVRPPESWDSPSRATSSPCSPVRRPSRTHDRRAQVVRVH